MISKAIRFGFIGVGEGGSRIAMSFSSKNYAACVINTGRTDSDKLDLKNSAKLVIYSGVNGAGKDLQIGEMITSENQEVIKEFLRSNIVNKAEYAFITVGGGGGSGTGSLRPLANNLRKLGLLVGVIYTLPMKSEDRITKKNCLKGLKILIELLRKEVISTVLLIDNQKISENFPNLSVTTFWQQANFEIVRIFDTFNALPMKTSIYYSALDSMDYAKIITSQGFMTFGKTIVTEYRDKLLLADKMKSCVENGLMCNGYDLAKAKASGIILIGSDDILKRIPAVNIDYAYESIKEITTQGTIFKGIYRDESLKDRLMVFSVFSGLGLPEQQIEELKKEVIDLENGKKETEFDLGIDLEDDSIQVDPLFSILRKKKIKKF